MLQINNPQHIPILKLPSDVWYEGWQYDISPLFVPTDGDRQFLIETLKYEGTPEAVIHFSENCSRLTDYGYWFFLSTLWVLYTGWSELNL